MKKITLSISILLFITLCCGAKCFADEEVLQVFAYENGLARYTNSDGKMGIIQASGNILVPAIYDDISVFDQNGLAISSRTVDQESYCGLIDQNGSMIVDDHMFCYIGALFHPNLGYSNQYGTYGARGNDGETYAIFSDGTIAQYPDRSILKSNAFLDTLNMSSFFVQGSVFLRSADGWRLYDTENKPLSSEAWDGYVPFPNGGGAVRKDELWGIVDHEGKLIVDYQYTICPEYTSYGIIVGNAIIAEKRPLWGMISLDGTELLPLQFDHIATVSEDRIAVAYDKKYGYMNSTFEWVIPPQWETASDFHHHAACVSNGSEISVIDDSGIILINLPDLSKKRVFISDYIAVYDESEKIITLMNRSGEVVLFLENAIIDIEAQVADGLLPIGIINTSQVEYGYLNLDTKDIIIEPQWCEIANFINGSAIVCYGENEFYGVIDTKGNYIIEPIYSSISRIKNVDFIYFEAEIESEDAYHYYVYNSSGEVVQYIHYTTPVNG